MPFNRTLKVHQLIQNFLTKLFLCIHFIYKNKSYDLVKNKLLNQTAIDPKKSLLIIREQGVGDEILYSSMYSDLLSDFNNIDYLLNYFEEFNSNLSKKTLNFYLKSVSNP